VAVEGVDKFKWELDRYMDALEIKGYGDIGRTWSLLVCGWVILGLVQHRHDGTNALLLHQFLVYRYFLFQSCCCCGRGNTG